MNFLAVARVELFEDWHKLARFNCFRHCLSADAHDPNSLYGKLALCFAICRSSGPRLSPTQ
ncbi:hypothetical protein [Phyllobacterium myrsinacearum]|uniref:Uncharacterized protein n=1 Tax=Phyllobacterium myrsinacearum TaxID=28101 RepID=A0A839EMT6_9HYPH|nr:hypothetical protein [Phyllobacterium myrsinacearum]MBA8881391.1 hypothetical protein [Phyllobacterium myrsinacearum]